MPVGHDHAVVTDLGLFAVAFHRHVHCGAGACINSLDPDHRGVERDPLTQAEVRGVGIEVGLDLPVARVVGVVVGHREIGNWVNGLLEIKCVDSYTREVGAPKFQLPPRSSARSNPSAGIPACNSAFSADNPVRSGTDDRRTQGVP